MKWDRIDNRSHHPFSNTHKGYNENEGGTICSHISVWIYDSHGIGPDNAHTGRDNTLFDYLAYLSSFAAK
jgi:hypothetical protein